MECRVDLISNFKFCTSSTQNFSLNIYQFSFLPIYILVPIWIQDTRNPFWHLHFNWHSPFDSFNWNYWCHFSSLLKVEVMEMFASKISLMHQNMQILLELYFLKLSAEKENIHICMQPTWFTGWVQKNGPPIVIE